MFRAAADQLEGDEGGHADLRQRACDLMVARREEFEPFVEDDQGFDTYIKRMRNVRAWGRGAGAPGFPAHCRVGRRHAAAFEARASCAAAASPLAPPASSFAPRGAPPPGGAAAAVQDGVWGGHMELQAVSLLTGANIYVYQEGQPRWSVSNHPPGAGRRAGGGRGVGPGAPLDHRLAALP
jgi:hypothetical protein